MPHSELRGMGGCGAVRATGGKAGEGEEVERKPLGGIAFKTHDNGDADIQDNHGYHGYHLTHTRQPGEPDPHLNQTPRKASPTDPTNPGFPSDGHAGHLRGAFDINNLGNLPNGEKYHQTIRVLFPFKCEGNGDIDLCRMHCLTGTLKSFMEDDHGYDSDEGRPTLGDERMKTLNSRRNYILAALILVMGAAVAWFIRDGSGGDPGSGPRPVPDTPDGNRSPVSEPSQNL